MVEFSVLIPCGWLYKESWGFLGRTPLVAGCIVEDVISLLARWLAPCLDSNIRKFIFLLIQKFEPFEGCLLDWYVWYLYLNFADLHSCCIKAAITLVWSTLFVFSFILNYQRVHASGYVSPENDVTRFMKIFPEGDVNGRYFLYTWDITTRHDPLQSDNNLFTAQNLNEMWY